MGATEHCRVSASHLEADRCGEDGEPYRKDQVMDYLIIALCAFLASGLTLYSGFGLGTLLLPVFALFVPVEAAVGATALVHGANNILKVAVVGQYANRDLVLRFGIPAVVAAFAGAATLGYVAHLGPIFSYAIGVRTAIVTPVKLIMGTLMFVFALFELVPNLRSLRVDRKYLILGGLLSGFFGGFSGHQGALRSAFLTKVGISSQAFVGTNALIGFLVDLARIAVYGSVFFLAGTGDAFDRHQWSMIAVGCLAAFAGVLIGKRYLHTLTMHTIQTITGSLLLGISIVLLAGVL
jgi:uncharacterized membrane protein YfcA